MTKRGKRFGSKQVVQHPRSVVNLPGWKESVKSSKGCDWTKLSPEVVEGYHDKEKINKLINEIVFDPTMRRYTNEMDPDFLKRLDQYAQKCAARQNCKLVLDDQLPSTSGVSDQEQACEMAKWKAKKRVIRRLAVGKSIFTEEKEKSSDSDDSDDDEVFLPGAGDGRPGNEPGSSGSAPGICA